MNVLIVARNQKEELQICAEIIGNYSNVNQISVAIIDDNCIVVDESNIQAEKKWDLIVYVSLLNAEFSMTKILSPVMLYRNQLDNEGKIIIIIPVAKVGEIPVWSYKSIFVELMRKGIAIQDVKPIQYTCMSEQIMGYEFELLCRRKKSMLVLCGKNHLINYNIRQITDVYRKMGWDIVFGEQEESNIYKLLQQGVDRLFIINNVGWIASLADDEKNIWDELGIPSMNYILDHPMCYDDTLKLAPKTGTLLCVDNNHVEYVRRFYPHIKNVLFVPLAGDNELSGIAKDWKNREIEVLYVGGYKGNQDIALLSASEKDILEKLLQNKECTTESIIEKIWKEKNDNYCDEQLKEEILRLRKVDWYIMTYIRVEVIRTLIRGGIDVTVYGSGWEAFDEFDNPHFIYKGSISQEECLEQMKSSKIVLNVMPWFKEGTHDRVINAMLSGAVSLSDSSAYMDKVFEAGKDYICYDIKHLEKLPEIVKDILKSDNFNMRNRAYRKANEKHRWMQRIVELEEMYEE